MLKIVLSCSLLANLALAVLFITDPSRPLSEDALAGRRGVLTIESPAAASASAARGVGSEISGADYYEHLLSLGLTSDEAKTLLLARVARETDAALDRPEDRYWESGAEERLHFALTSLEAQAQARSRLISIFGGAAERDPAFAKLFRPLDPHFAFLDSQEQLAVQRFALERQLANLSREGVSSEDAIRSLAEVLAEESLLEYELRDSPLANRLRSAGADLSEQEFRSAFVILTAMNSGAGDLRDHLDARAALQRLLGPRGFLRLWSSRDPVFRMVDGIGRRFGWSAALTMNSYEALLEYEERLLSAVESSGADAASLAGHLQEANSALAGELAAMLGEEGARALMDARATHQFPVDQTGFIPRGEEGAL